MIARKVHTRVEGPIRVEDAPQFALDARVRLAELDGQHARLEAPDAVLTGDGAAEIEAEKAKEEAAKQPQAAE